MLGFDDFYTVSTTMKEAPQGMWQMGINGVILTHLENAKDGCRESESRLINRIGQIKRNVPFEVLNSDLKNTLKIAVEWLRTTGRKVDLNNPDPSLWITKRDGSPRW